MADIPSTQTVVVIENPGEDAKVVLKHDVPVPQPKEHEVLVKMECCGLCHSDVRALLAWGPYNPIPGHEGIGTVVSLGSSTPSTLKLGSRIGIKWLYSACGTCSTCTTTPHAHPNNCASQLNTGKGAVPGVLQQYAIADARYVTYIPDGVDSEIAAPLLCAGLSMAGAVGRLEPEMRVGSGEWLVLPGAGGGLGHLGLQIAARVKGYKVIAVDAGDARRDLCMRLGASAFIDFSTPGVDIEAEVKALTNGEGAAGIIVVPGAESAYRLAPKLVRNRGVIVCVGLPKSGFDIPITPLECANRGLVIKGSSTGNEREMEELFEWAKEGKVVPMIEVRGWEESGDVLWMLRRDEVRGRIVVKIPS